MKHFKNLLFVALVAVLFGAVSCNEVSNMDGQYGSLSINVSAGKLATKAEAPPVFPEEAVIKDVQIYIFKVPKAAADVSDYSKYQLYKYIVATGTDAVSHEEGNLNANEQYVVAVFANGLSATSTLKPNGYVHQTPQNLAALRLEAVNLDSSNPGTLSGTSYTGQFAMYGESEPVSVAANVKSTANVEVKRFVSRVRLLSVQNKLPEAYGKLRIERVFLINGYSTWNFNGTLAATTDAPVTGGKFNWAGRQEGHASAETGSSYIIDSADDCGLDGLAYGNQTFKALGGTAYEIDNYNVLVRNGDASAATNSTKVMDGTRGLCFYAFPNPNANDASTAQSTAIAGSFNGPVNNVESSTARTRLVVYASFTNNNVTSYYYYPVTVPGESQAFMERNKSYDVNLIVSGFGSDDPNREPIKGSIQTVVTVRPWDGQYEYNPEI